MIDEPDVRASTQTELLAIVPYLLGFHPRDSMVFVCLHGQRVSCTARVDLAALDDVDAVAELMARLRGGARADFLIAIAYSDDANLAARVLDLVECTAVDVVIQDLLWVHDDRWESLCTSGSGAMDPASTAAAEAVYHGLSAAQSRSAVVSVLDSQSVPPDWPEWQRAGQARVRRMGLDRRRRRLAALVDRPAGHPYESSDLGELVALLADARTRDSVLCSVTRHTAPGLMASFLQAARQLPDDHSCVHAVGMFGICAWLSGQGALMVAAIERGERIQPDVGLISLLNTINQMALPPQWWEEVRRDLVA